MESNTNHIETCKAIENGLNKLGVKYAVSESDSVRIISIKSRAKNVPFLELLMIVDNEGEIAERIVLAREIPVGLREQTLHVLNGANVQYKLAKFVLDEDGDVYLYREDSIGHPNDEWGEPMAVTGLRLLHIADSLMPEIMKIKWSSINESITEEEVE